MKKYFFKYIPQEGEPQIGDISFCDMNERYLAYKFFIVNKSCIQLTQMCGWKKYKLFLCSKDIKVTFPPQIATEELSDGSYDQFQIDTENDIYSDMIAKHKQFLIIGEVQIDTNDLSRFQNNYEIDENLVQIIFDNDKNLTYVKILKKYFTKYLITNNNLRTSRYVLYNNEVYRNCSPLCNRHPDNYTFIMKDSELTGKHVKWEELKSVELFLCSRNIQIGDKVTYKSHIEGYWFKGTVAIYTNNYTTFEEDRDNDKDKESFYISYNSKNVYKVIGKILPKDEWIEEGMEFDDHEIRFQLGYPNDPNLMEIDFVEIIKKS